MLFNFFAVRGDKESDDIETAKKLAAFYGLTVDDIDDILAKYE